MRAGADDFLRQIAQGAAASFGTTPRDVRAVGLSQVKPAVHGIAFELVQKNGDWQRIHYFWVGRYLYGLRVQAPQSVSPESVAGKMEKVVASLQPK